jgi:hypothetical protein
VAVTYSPVLSLQPHAEACGSGEAYRPTTVDIMLGRQNVVLRDLQGKVVRRAPTPRELWGLGQGYGYERQFRRLNGGRAPSVYAHVASDVRGADRGRGSATRPVRG